MDKLRWISFIIVFFQFNRQFVAPIRVVNGRLSSDANVVKCKKVIHKDRLKFTNCDDIDIIWIATIIAQESKLTVIDISNLNLESIDEIDLSHNRELKTFIASNNKLKKFPTKVFSKAPVIEEIDLSANQLKHIETHTFDGISTLVKVNLSSNHIYDIDGNAFINSKHLACVDLSNNQIPLLYRINFCRDCVVTLHLEQNPFSVLNYENIPDKNGISIHLSWSEIRQIYFQTHAGQFNVILNDTFNAILAKPDGNLQFDLLCGEGDFHQILSVEIDEHQMENLPILLQCLSPTVERLVLSGNKLSSLDQTAFMQFSALTQLTLSNTQLEEFDLNAIRVAKNQLRILDISMNGLKSISNVHVLTEFITLIELNVGGNEIENIADLIDSLPASRLSKLDLSGNNLIGSLKPAAFARIENLLELKLRNTQLSIPDFNPFKGLKNLFSIDFSYNNFEKVNLAAMTESLQKLQQFTASNCHIRKISQVTRYLGAEIEDFDLSGNILEDLNENSFQTFQMILTLNLSKTNIKHFTPGTIQYLPDIHTIDISNNELLDLNGSAMPESLLELYVNDNRLRRILNLSRKHLPLLTKLDISGNCFTIEYVKEIQRNLTDIELVNPFKQKPKEQCAKYGEKTVIDPNKDGNNTGTIIAIVISVGTLLAILCVCFVYRDKLLRMLKKVRNVNETSVRPSLAQHIQTAESVTIHEPIYEELDDYVRYDKLWHEFNAMPLPSESQSSYNRTSAVARVPDNLQNY